MFIIGGGVLVIIGIIVAYTITSSDGKKKDQEPTPTPAAQYKEVDDSVVATIEKASTGREITLTISGLDGAYTGIEYELNYQTDKGPQGTFSGVTPIQLDNEADTFEREITLGSCSTGGRCTYDTGVHDFRLTVKLHSQDGTVYLLKKEFASI